MRDDWGGGRGVKRPVVVAMCSITVMSQSRRFSIPLSLWPHSPPWWPWEGTIPHISPPWICCFSLSLSIQPFHSLSAASLSLISALLLVQSLSSTNVSCPFATLLLSHSSTSTFSSVCFTDLIGTAGNYLFGSLLVWKLTNMFAMCLSGSGPSCLIDCFSDSLHIAQYVPMTYWNS